MKQYGIALIEKPLDEGLNRNEVCDLFDMLSGVDVIPIEIQGEFSTAMGFISLTDAEFCNYDYSKIEEKVKSILNDIENENKAGEYEVENNHGITTIWMNRR